MSTISIRACLRSTMTKHIPGNPNIIVQNVPGAASLIAANQVYNIAKPDGLTLGGDLSGALFRSADQETGSEIRLGKMAVDRQSGEIEPSPLHARRHAVQVDGRHPQGGHGAEVRLHRYRLHRLLHAQAYGGSARQPSSTSCPATCPDRISIWRWNAASSSAGPSRLPPIYAREPFISWRKRNFTNVLIQTGSQARCSDQGCADDL